MEIDKNSKLPLYIQLAEVIRADINNGKYASGNKLLSERNMASKYNLSRNTVRQAFRILEQDGIISANHGSGTFSTETGNMILSRIDIFYENMEFLRSAGYTPEKKLLSIDVIPADQFLSGKFGLEPGSPLIKIEKLFYANAQAAIYTIDFVPKTADLDLDECMSSGLLDDYFGFIEKMSRHQIAYGLSDIIPVAADRNISEKLAISEGTPILLMEELFLDKLQKKKIGLGINYYGSFIKFNILRTRNIFKP